MPGYVRADVRREQLLAAAREVLVRDGLESLTLRGVAGQAGVRLSTLQYIFASRSDLVRALAERTLQDAGLGQFQVGQGGLDAELRRRVDWFATRFLADPAIVELVRHEFVSQANRRDLEEGIEYPLGRPILSEAAPPFFAEIQDRGGEQYAISTADLVRMWMLAQMGLLFAFFQERDLDRYHHDALTFVDQIVGVARARPSRARPGSQHSAGEHSTGSDS